MLKEPLILLTGGSFLLEENLKRIVCLHPELIEEGFVVKEEEYPVKCDHICYRCDLMGEDKNGGTVFV